MSAQAANRNGRKATITEVALRAGVSLGTASLALNGSSRVASETVRRVREAAEALAYVPDYAASSLRRRSTESIALVVPDVANPVYVAMAKAVQRVAKERGYHLSLVSTDNVLDEEVHAVKALARRQVDGLILCSLRVTDELAQAIDEAGAPVCVIGRTRLVYGLGELVRDAQGAEDEPVH
ncbi:MAG TPA: LacI family DNA-binding transcriptional regulator, partial [Deinococcales bacterium]|nr:LacI family DNA-binding transcriptional regulator [Deinococcales bacterium]